MAAPLNVRAAREVAVGLVVPKPATDRVARGLLISAGVEFAFLLVTGLFLVFFYRPAPANAWGDIRGVQTAVTFGQIVRVAHRVASYLLGLTLLFMAVIGVTLSVSRSLRRPGHQMAAAAAVGAAISGFLAALTGYLLPWDQLALWAVTVGTNMMGFRPILDPSVHIRFVLIGGSTVSVGTIRFWFWVHVLLVPAVLVLLGLVLVRRPPARSKEPDGHTRLG